MGAKRIIKAVAGVALVGLLVLLCLSGPYHEPDGSVKPLFGTVKVQLSSGRYPADARELKGELYCLPCHDKMGVPICGACRRPIEGRVVNAMGKQWHVEVGPRNPCTPVGQGCW